MNHGCATAMKPAIDRIEEAGYEGDDWMAIEVSYCSGRKLAHEETAELGLIPIANARALEMYLVVQRVGILRLEPVERARQAMAIVDVHSLVVVVAVTVGAKLALEMRSAEGGR